MEVKSPIREPPEVVPPAVEPSEVWGMISVTCGNFYSIGGIHGIESCCKI